uniref:hypothetical protein n=1 Tax=Paractinoplanes polyasparticus TaxID=2856853 RepID=UPI001C84BBFC|nr:hypothetical protein [Actinoplanes polyasparticus]
MVLVLFLRTIRVTLGELKQSMSRSDGRDCGLPPGHPDEGIAFDGRALLERDAFWARAASYPWTSFARGSTH